MASFRLLLSFLLACVSLPRRGHRTTWGVQAQYVQAGTTMMIPNPNTTVGQPPFLSVPAWRPTTADAFQRIIDIGPELVVLEYNCYYMRDICKNAENWFSTPRGQSRTPPFRFAYDFHTGKRNPWRSYHRREASCPGSWKSRTTCPHSDQNIVMRHDGPWRYKDLEPNTNINEIRADVWPNGQRRPSEVRYTCDEFPPATWIEGGSGSMSLEAAPMDAQTRCAAFRCDKTKGVKAEQNWQATSHNALQSSLKAVIRRRNAGGLNEFPFYLAKDSIVWFEFRRANAANGVAAKVFTYTAQNQNPPAVEKQITQAKRDLQRSYSAKSNDAAHKMLPEELDRAAFWDWADKVTTEELIALGPAHVSEKHILANHTEAAMQMPGMGLPWMDWAGSGDDDDDDEDEDAPALPEVVSGPPRADPNKAKRVVLPLATGNWSSPFLGNASATDLQRARQVLDDAIRKSTELNAARHASPARNRYGRKPGTAAGPRLGVSRYRVDEDEESPSSLLLEITDEIATAAALVSEADAAVEAQGSAGNLTSRYSRRQVKAAASGTFWMEHIARMGTVPFGNDAGYKVFRNVLDYGAKGDGVQDDTKAIRLAMTDGNRCGEKCNGATVTNAIVYFPPGTYRVSTPIVMPFGTQVIGDANDWPTLLAPRAFVGNAVLRANQYTGGGNGTDGLDQQWYVNTANFYRQIRNLKIDITQTRAAQEVAALHYQVAQATSLQNVELIALAGTTQRGIDAENGSGGVISDVTFRGGKYGFWGGNQQFTAQRLTFVGCDTGVHVIWDWGWVWKSITMTDVAVGFRLVREDKAKAKRAAKAPGNIGSASFLDSTFRNVQTAVVISPPGDKPGSGSTGLVLENVACEGVGKVVADTSGATILAPPAAGGKIDHWVLGPVYEAGTRGWSSGRKVGAFRRVPDLLDPQGAYFERAKPQYGNRPVGDFVHVKDFGARGDGVTDDTAAFQRALYESQGRILFVDAGSYILTGTVTIPVGSKIVGEAWSQLVASGPFFANAADPQVMIRVGANDGVVGDVEMQDLLFTNRGPTAGLILVQWNVRAATPGSAALWDCHVRIGGAKGTDLTPAECPALTTGVVPPGCLAASLMMHITPRASGYFENMWLWVADHMIDDPDLVDANNTMVQNSVYVARGLLVESKSPTWLYGTSSEHAVFYQYNFHKAQNIFAGMIQTESPYYQPTPSPPAPFEGAVGKLPGDPDYAVCKGTGGDKELGGCDESWAVMMRECANVFVAGAGLYSWFSTYTQDCIDQHACQKALVLLENNHAGVRIQHLISIGAKYIGVMDGKAISALDFLNVESHPRWSQVSLLDVASDGALAELVWIDPKIWDMEQPAFTCVPPCLVAIPPWTKATRIVEYPRITVTAGGTWSTTITRSPLTITQVHFEAVTLTVDRDSKNLKRRTGAQGFSAFWPVPATTPGWPPATYTDQAGNVVETTPTAAFPLPPASIGPNAPAPLGGSWPKRAIQPMAGLVDEPTVSKCYWDGWTELFLCGDVFGDPDGDFGDDPDDLEEGDEAQTICPDKTTTSSTTRKTTVTEDPPKPTESPLEEGRPMDNQRSCYNQGQKATNAQLQAAARSFCRGLGREGNVLRNPLRSVGGNSNLVRTARMDPPANGQWPIHIDLELLVKPGCQFVIDYARCERYLRATIDSCNCGGENGKQGGIIENRCLRWREDPQITL